MLVCASLMTQAATIRWTSGTLYGTKTADGGWSDTKITSGDVTAYLFVLDNQTAYDNLYNKDVKTLSDNVYGAYKDKLSSAEATKSTGTTISLTDNVTYSTGDRQYAALLYILTDGEKQYYIGNVGDTGALKSSSNVSIANMATNIGGTGGTSMTSVGWQPVPEPTSAMLLLLGMAGLMLKRKRA